MNQPPAFNGSSSWRRWKRAGEATWPGGAAIFFLAGAIFCRVNARAKATRLKWNLSVQGYEKDGGINELPQNMDAPIAWFSDFQNFC
jgi:hypothetical protein